MGKTINNYYLLTLGIFSLVFGLIHFVYVSRLKSSLADALEKSRGMAINYAEIKDFENNYYKTQDSSELNCIEYAYKELDKKNSELSASLGNKKSGSATFGYNKFRHNFLMYKKLEFSLNEVEESVLKHKESFYRSIVYLNDMGKEKDSDLYFIEQFNLNKSKDIFEYQEKTFYEKMENFNNEIIGYSKTKQITNEKILLAVLAVIFFITTVLLKYINIWGENYGYGIKKSEKNYGKRA